jgi:hypothetical protein
MTTISFEQALAGLYGATDRLEGIRRGVPDATAVHDATAYLGGLADVADKLHPGQRIAFNRASLRLMDALVPLAPAAQRSSMLTMRNQLAVQVDVTAAEAKASSSPQEVRVVSMPERHHLAMRDREGKIEGSIERDA